MQGCDGIDFLPNEHPHIRYNPLKGEWVLVSPHRLDRPWQGQVEQANGAKAPPHNNATQQDPLNPLAPGGRRGNGEINPKYESTFVFDNDFPALKEKVPAPPLPIDPLFQMCSAAGACRVLCFNPRSEVTIATMKLQEIYDVIEMWVKQTLELGRKYDWVQIFENKGEVMGCSNPHPHCQIWASSFIPNEPRVKDIKQREYYFKYGRPLLLDYVQKELDKEERLVFLNEDWVVVVPFWAVWPFETLIIPRFHAKRFNDLNNCQKATLARAMKCLNIKYDNLFNSSFPYTMGWHGAPTGKFLCESAEHWVFHGIYYPPLLRSATIKKFMVGYEMLAQAQRDLTPETAAKMLRETPEFHYTEMPKTVEKGKEDQGGTEGGDELKKKDSKKKKKKKEGAKKKTTPKKKK